MIKNRKKSVELIIKTENPIPPMFMPGDFEIIRTVGVGAFGRVCLVQLNEEVCNDFVFMACKIVKCSFLIKTKNVDNMKRELDILQEVSDCHFFPKLHTVSFFYDRICVFMEFCEGGELFSRIQKNRGLDYKNIRFYGAEILMAIKILHEKEIIYRDLKSENILLTAEGHIKIVDFGLSVKTAENIHTVAGTLECMAPEVVKKLKYGKEVDLWSFGVLLYEMLYCQTPFGSCEKSNKDEVIENIISKEPRFHETVLPEFKDLIISLLRKNRKGRLSSIEEIMKHEFFKGIDWDCVINLNYKPFYKPGLRYCGDVCNFDTYKESIFNFHTEPCPLQETENSERN